MQSNGQWVSEEFRQIDETVTHLLEAAGGAALSTAEADRIYMEAVGGIKKQRIRGAGSYGSSLASDCRSAAPRASTYCPASIQDLVSQRMEAERNEMEEWKRAEQARMEEWKLAEQARMNEQIKSQVEAQTSQMQEQLTSMNELMKNFMQSQGHSRHP